MGGHLLESSATGRHVAGRRLGTTLYGTVGRTGQCTVAPYAAACSFLPAGMSVGQPAHLPPQINREKTYLPRQG